MTKIKIINYEPERKEDFIAISEKWLHEHDMMEEKDQDMLNYPYKEIIMDGGMIFFAVTDDEEADTAGTASMVYKGDNVYEVVKVGVKEEYKSMGIGNLLMERCTEYGKEKGAEKVILYTHENLGPAVNLYEKHGFEQVPMDEDTDYETVDIKMEKEI